jgi:hypothetical protein
MAMEESIEPMNETEFDKKWMGLWEEHDICYFKSLNPRYLKSPNKRIASIFCNIWLYIDDDCGNNSLK